ncbi:MAG: hypothetical protein EOM11_03055, partial [Erysipelotrichia bacterium]|nr:hypothetical protein [Erysipelotrichia bacterium]
MFNLHKCRCDKIQEVKVYNSKEVEKLYQKVLVASAESDVVSKMNFASRRIIKHSDQFQMKMIKNNFSLYLVTVIIRHRSYRFVVDTGAQISAILS